MNELYELTIYDKNEDILKHEVVSAISTKEAIIKSLEGFEREVEKVIVNQFTDEDLPF